ncbi:MAG: amidophosphoribosyltransferase [Bdellovibrionaceae bacterium]|nr:amidophosphoribosyltransferase [Pseudobdellovibrionaceae bacterium]|tara:strand:- start:204978 stop:206366 length:1389 start_codon:yes stop_codon:yes gene_type:complete
MHHWKEECAVFGAFNDPEAARMTYLGLYALQHRGQESTGIVANNEGQHLAHKGLGLVGDVYTEEDLLRLKGNMALGHVRYSTTGQNLLENAQPLTAVLSSGPLALAHNGNIVNSSQLRQQMIHQGAIFQGSNDTEILLHMIARMPQQDMIQALKSSLVQMQGAYSMALMTQDRLIAIRDPLGFRPLVIGHRPIEGGGHSVVVASETCAFDLIGAKYIREVEPGEIFWVDKDGEHSERFSSKGHTKNCIFEHVYFARPDSLVFGKNVYETRKQLGRVLAQEFPVEDADIVVPVPDSGVPAAIGYSQESGVPFELGIIRNHYVGRTFIQPSQSIRSFGVKIKLNPQREVLEGKKVVVIDDSLVRGTTSQKIISLLRQAGAKEIHFRVASPPTRGPCFYGVDTPKKDQLIASQKSLDETREFIHADTLGYLSVEGMFNAVGGQPQSNCAACFDLNYPTELFGQTL